MKWRLLPILLWLFVHCLSLGGCAVLEQVIKPKEPLEVRLEKTFLERALEYERQGELPRALQAYEAALAVIMAKKKGVESSLRHDAEKHYSLGLQLQEAGKYAKARQEFLAALSLWPDYPEVVRLLKPSNLPSHTNYLVHEVKKGEVLTAIAQKYYNDPKKFRVIGRFNDLEDAAKLYAGMKLKIPEIEGVRFHRPENRRGPEAPLRQEGAEEGGEGANNTLPASEELSATARLEAGSLPEEEFPGGQSQEVDYDPVATYEELGVSLLEEGQYLAALHEFKKVLNTDPARTRVKGYMAWAHHRQGVDLFEKGEYLEASQHFETALSLDEQCTSCREYLQRSKNAYKEVHYLKGIKYFEEEKLNKAIEEWKLVEKFASDYKQVQDYLRRARRLSEKIQQLKGEP